MVSEVRHRGRALLHVTRTVDDWPILFSLVAKILRLRGRLSEAGGGALERQPLQRDHRLGVLGLRDGGVELAQRPGDDLDAFILLGRGLSVAVAQIPGQKQPDVLVGESDARVEAAELAPVSRRLGDLLAELTPGAGELT